MLKTEELFAMAHLRLRLDHLTKLIVLLISIQNWEESVKLSKNLNISKDLILILTEYKNGRSMENLPIVPGRRQIGTVLILKMFSFTTKKYLNTVFFTDVSILIEIQNN